MKKVNLILVFLVALFFIQIEIKAQAVNEQKKTIGIDFFTQVKSISNLKEKNGEIFFVIRQANKEANSYTSDLYQLKDGKPIRLTSTGNVSDYFFLGESIIFRNLRDEKDKESIRKGNKLTVYQQLTPGYGEASEWLRLPYAVRDLKIIDKDKFFFTAGYNRQEESAKDLIKEKDGDYLILDELPFWSNGRGFISGQRTHLFFYNKGVITPLSSSLTENVASLELSPDNKKLIFTKTDYSTKALPGNTLVSLDVENLQRKEQSLFDRASYGNLTFINNDEVVLTINRSIERDRQENSGFYRFNLVSGEISEIYNGEIYGLGNSIGSDIKSGGRADLTFDKSGIRYVSTVVDQALLIHVAYKDAKVSFLSPRDISIQEYLPYKDGFLALAAEGQAATEVFFIDKNGKTEPLSFINRDLFAEYSIVSPIEVKFTNDDGRELNGYVLPPANYEKGKKYPAILNIHGGPRTVYGTVFFHEMQYWANKGYAVFFTNPTGSDGRGSSFANLRGRFGEIDYSDIMKFTDAVLDQVDFIDEARIGVTGGSYGGVLTNWIIGHTDRFKAAATQRSISSWLSFSNTSDIGHTYTYSYFGTNIWKNSDLLWDRSPLKYADKVKTPTLILHSEEDYRCWLAEGLQLYYALQYFDVPTRMVLFKGENHELSRSGKPLNRIKRLDEITKWFDKYL